MKPVLTLTMNPTIDMNTTIDHVIPERKLRCGPVERDPGGGGINVSRAIRNLGGKSVAIYPGGGPTGQVFEELLNAEGIAHRPVRAKGWTRENFIVLEESTGQQFRFGTPGPHMEDEEWQRCLDELRIAEPKPAIIAASGSLPPGAPDDLYARVARIGKDLGSLVIVDTSGPAFRKALDEGVYLIKPNLRELRQLIGEPLGEEHEQEEAAMQLVRSGKARVVVVSAGAGGAFMATRDGVERMRSPTVPIRSKVGAGDSMVAGIVFGMAHEKPVREAVLLGIASGAAAVMTPGTELCRREDVERLYAQMTSRDIPG
jgi:6-phosphofructokinase 2